MIGYRCYLFGRDGEINREDAFTAADDISAVDQVCDIFKTNKYSGIEIWQGARIVHIEGVSSKILSAGTRAR